MRERCSCYHPCMCPTDIHYGIKECPLCKKPICPDCGSCDVVAISRVTGYLSDFSGWNNAKKQELKDRKRVSVP
jgi:anaerobic ribonucleoside-triphosphate reductase